MGGIARSCPCQGPGVGLERSGRSAVGSKDRGEGFRFLPVHHQRHPLPPKAVRLGFGWLVASQRRVFRPAVPRALGLLRRTFDAVAAVTVFPVWAWLAPGFTLAALGLDGAVTAWFSSTLAGWFVFLLAFAEEPWSLLRSLTPPGVAPERTGEALRVVSLNCNVGDASAAGEVARYRPDVVLLQESPSRGEVEAVARALFGADAGVVSGVDASMIVRGRVVPADLTPEQRSYFVQAGSGSRRAPRSRSSVPGSSPPCSGSTSGRPECWREQAGTGENGGISSGPSPGGSRRSRAISP